MNGLIQLNLKCKLVYCFTIKFNFTQLTGYYMSHIMNCWGIQLESCHFTIVNWSEETPKRVMGSTSDTRCSTKCTRSKINDRLVRLLPQPPRNTPLIARFMGPTWGPSGADRTQVDPMLAPWTLLSGTLAPRDATYAMPSSTDRHHSHVTQDSRHGKRPYLIQVATSHCLNQRHHEPF